MPDTTTLLLRRVVGPAAAPALAMLGGDRSRPDLAATSADATIYAMVDVTAPGVDPVAAARVVGPSPDGTAELAALCVAPPYRGRGLGGRILGEVVDVLRGQGAVRVNAVVGENGVARRLLARAGFKVTDPAGTRLGMDL